ncbi:uncharacterized protein AB675_3282 [Cyphellophora attinorum]|uniref:Xylanolytic transcriptional activator regulatory domain-containing protein n=1 Tax=Cyphellophora attinorum TaxID=1664694 RepID=A0A0N1HPU4_9EURO|nr:uncharacterized protein AB675_3282 [Phialophora attinorum]KPI39827.1 hypothetical protein AB675_3282 [Phialophora attinorum]
MPVQRRGPKGPRKRKLSQDENTQSTPTSATNGSVHKFEASTSGPASSLNRSPHIRTCSGVTMTGNVHMERYSPTWIRTPTSDHFNTHRHDQTPETSSTQQHPRQHDSVSPQWSDPVTGTATDKLCDRDTLRRIMDDYILYVYPAIPIFHMPTFHAAFDAQKDTHDVDFFCLLLGLAALTVGILPSKFRDYQRAARPVRFLSRVEMIDYCYAQTVNSRTSAYFDEVSHTKWAISHLFFLAYIHVGKVNLSRMVELECNLFARLLELHRPSAYVGLSCIEVQLRKRGFWLMFYPYVHLQYSNLRKERLSFIDCAILHELDLEELLPVPHDDEQITETSYGSPPPPDTPSLAEGFNWRSRLFWSGVKSINQDRQSRRDTIHCQCTRRQDLSAYLNFLHARLRELNYLLDGAPWYLRQWVTKSESGQHNSHPDASLNLQMAVIRTDIHVTHVWLQSLLMDHIESYHPVNMGSVPLLPLPQISTMSPPTPDTPVKSQRSAKVDWAQREDLCRQLLQVLYMAPDLSLEALGTVLVHKVRDVAVSLLACPYDDNAAGEGADAGPEIASTGSLGPATRAKAYLADFSRKLNELDMAEGMSSHILQSWVDTGRMTDGRYDHW